MVQGKRTKNKDTRQQQGRRVQKFNRGNAGEQVDKNGAIP